MQSTLDSIHQLLAAGSPAAARTACLNLINSYPDYSVSYNALNLLRETFSTSDVAGPKGLYLSLLNTKVKKPLYAVAGLILASIDKPNTLSWLDQVIQSYGTDSVAELALFDKFVWYYFEQQDRSNAVRISGQLDSLFHLSIAAIEAHKILGDSLGANAGQTLQKPDAERPIAYMLYQNYPNPFNPSTNIRYALTEDANVSLIVYDILGREVTTLVNNVEAAGYHTIVWNATRSASGVYFLRIRVTSGYGVTKYTKVTKLMVLK